MPTPVIKLEQLNISFGEKQVLHDFSLTIYPGQSLAVVGESGSGKLSDFFYGVVGLEG